MMLNQLKHDAVARCGLLPDQLVLVGVSGGADSLALMHGLHKLGYPMVIAHLDHALREDSTEDATFVRQLAGQMGLPFVEKRVDVRTFAVQRSQSIEEAARNVRYTFLFDTAREVNAQALATAHHADDQVETVLMHFLRGAALGGLSGMDYRRVMPIWDDTIPIVRPLLGVWRNEIEAYLGEVGWSPREDLSNQDTTYFRNRLRHELIPELETYNPQARQVLWRMAQVLREEDHYLDKLADVAWERVFVSQEAGLIQLYHAGFMELPKPLQRRVLMHAVRLLRPDLRDVGLDAIMRGLAFATQPSISGEIDLVARLNLVAMRDVLILKDWEANLPDWGKPLLPEGNFSVHLAPGSPVALRHGWWLTASWMDVLPENWAQKIQYLGPYEVWLDAKRLALPLTVRGRKEGERWQPLGMGSHHQSFQDFFITQKVPEHLRDLWPLVCSGEEVAWVTGIRPSEAYKVTQKTSKVLVLRIVKSMG
jgi:tRNA(Ile)-lysidine synthase